MTEPASVYSAAFVAAFTDTAGIEGGLSMVASDPGNWTGGRVGVGTLRGTKYGIAANTFPTLDIASLTPAQAEVIYYAQYWLRILGDKLPPAVARVTFDAAVNSGVSRGVKLLQAAADTTADGLIGAGTLAAVARWSPAALATECLVERTLFMAALSTFPTFGHGWIRRLFHLKESVA